MYPKRISLVVPNTSNNDETLFGNIWLDMVDAECHNHKIWSSDFMQVLKSPESEPKIRYQLAATWATNMVVGSYCFPRYVAALASRSEQDIVRHGLLENAWDESGGPHHTSRSHFWLAVRLARLLGLSDAGIESITALPDAQNYTDKHYKECAEGDFAVGLGMICLIEEFTTPEFTIIFRALLDSCNDGAGITPDEFVLGGGAEYFTANISDDERHREEMPKLVAAYLRESGVDLNNATEIEGALIGVREGMRLSISLRERFFGGIYDFVKSGSEFHKLIRVS